MDIRAFSLADNPTLAIIAKDFRDFVQTLNIDDIVGGRVVKVLSKDSYLINLKGFNVISQAQIPLEKGDIIRGQIQEIEPKVVLKLIASSKIPLAEIMGTQKPAEFVSQLKIEPTLANTTSDLKTVLQQLVSDKTLLNESLPEKLLQQIEKSSINLKEPVSQTVEKMTNQIKQVLQMFSEGEKNISEDITDKVFKQFSELSHSDQKGADALKQLYLNFRKVVSQIITSSPQSSNFSAEEVFQKIDQIFGQTKEITDQSIEKVVVDLKKLALQVIGKEQNSDENLVAKKFLNAFNDNEIGKKGVEQKIRNFLNMRSYEDLRKVLISFRAQSSNFFEYLKGQYGQNITQEQADNIYKIIEKAVNIIDNQRQFNIAVKNVMPFWYVQIPVVLNEELQNCEIKIVCNQQKQKRSKADSFTVGFLINTKSMGRIKIVLAVSNKTIYSNFVAEKDEIKQLIDENISKYVISLEDVGYKISKPEVVVSNDGFDESFEQNWADFANDGNIDLFA